MAGVYVRILMVVLASVLLATTDSHPTWLQDSSTHNKEGGEGVVPLVLLPLFPRHQQVVRDVARKRNAELLNTLLGSQDLSYMRSAGRR